MLTKEKLATTVAKLARIIPGMPSYQEREGLRAQDKMLREHITRRLEDCIGELDQLKSELTNQGQIMLLGDLDRWCRRLQRLADTVRFGRYGYASMFSADAIDEAKLAAVYEFDLQLLEELEGFANRVRAFVADSRQGRARQAMEPLKLAVAALDKKVRERDQVFSE